MGLQHDVRHQFINPQADYSRSVAAGGRTYDQLLAGKPTGPQFVRENNGTPKKTSLYHSKQLLLPLQQTSLSKTPQNRSIITSVAN